uniref:Zinc finger GRF-type domain-containing protein n=1 Tax=Oryza punctata TaxID=4537 RepID=A0A0E0LXM0_ORYPU
MALQRRNSMASQGSSFRAPRRQLSRFHLGPSGLPLVKCPRCGSPVVECKSWRQGGRVFFKCEKNEQYVPEACSFFKWYDSYQRMLEGMELDIIEGSFGIWGKETLGRNPVQGFSHAHGDPPPPTGKPFPVGEISMPPFGSKA